MGQKVHPKAFRLKINKTWDSKWFADGRDFVQFLKQDVKIRKYVLTKLVDAGIARVDIERSSNSVSVNIKAAKPGIVIGRGGQGAEDLKKEIHNKFLKDAYSRKRGIKTVNINISEVKNPGLESAIIKQQVISDLEKRMPFRRAAKQALGRAEKAGAKGVKIIIAGRLNGAEIARSETFFSGKIPLHTLRADIDYNRGAARTIYGAVGVKVWIYRGEVFEKKEDKQVK
jgi:small subunit ribosomal protein S3